MVDNSVLDKLYGMFFGEEAQQWAQADEAGRAAMLDESGLSDLSVADLNEGVAALCERLPAEQAALLSPTTTVGNQTPVTSTAAADVSGPEVTQVIEGDTNVAGA
ncbi:MAG: hypothetical protein GY929_18775, partial [Actinomycetia bacterium]|nr:hypothetical protein [Actinomycetes bacterium]